MFRKKRVLFGRAEKGGGGARQGGEGEGFWAKRIERTGGGGGFGEGEGDGEEGGPQAKPSSGRFRRAEPAGPGGAGAACGPGLRLAGAGGGGCRRGRRGQLPQGVEEVHGRAGKGKAGGDKSARRALRRSRSRRPEAAETAAGGLPCGPCPRMAQRPGMGFCGGNGRIGKLKECLLPFTAKMCYNISLGNFPKK